MTEKRYFKKMWEEEFYIFDSNTISESDFEEKLEYQDYKAFKDSMTGDDVVNRLNELEKENKDLEEARSYYQENFLTMKTERYQLKEENEWLEKENTNLIIDNKELKCTNIELAKKNEQLKSKNQRLEKIIDELNMELFEIKQSEDDNYNITDGLW